MPPFSATPHAHFPSDEHVDAAGFLEDEDVVAEELPSRPAAAHGDAEEEVVEGEF